MLTVTCWTVADTDEEDSLVCSEMFWISCVLRNHFHALAEIKIRGNVLHCRCHFLERIHHRAMQHNAHERYQNSNQGNDNCINRDGACDIRGNLLLQALLVIQELRLQLVE